MMSREAGGESLPEIFRKIICQDRWCALTQPAVKIKQQGISGQASLNKKIREPKSDKIRGQASFVDGGSVCPSLMCITSKGNRTHKGAAALGVSQTHPIPTSNAAPTAARYKPPKQ